MTYRIRGDVEIGRSIGFPLRTDSQLAFHIPSRPGVVVYNTDQDSLYKHDGTFWVSIEARKNTFVGETALAPATPGSPTVIEIGTYCFHNSIHNSHVFYTGTDTSTDPIKKIFFVDGSHNTLLLWEDTSGSAASKFVSTFVAADWVTVGPNLTITVAAATHGITDPTNVQVWQSTGTGSHTQVLIETLVDDTTKDVTIQMPTNNTTFDGKIHIS